MFRRRSHKLAPNNQWWLNKFAQEGMERRMHEHVTHANEKLSILEAEAQLVEANGSDRPWLTFKYHNVRKDIPAGMMTFMADNMSSIGLPSHKLYSPLRGLNVRFELIEGQRNVVRPPISQSSWNRVKTTNGQQQPGYRGMAKYGTKTYLIRRAKGTGMRRIRPQKSSLQKWRRTKNLNNHDATLLQLP